MRMKATKTPKSSGWLAKVSRVLIFTMLFSLVMPQGWYKSNEASAAVANATPWAILGSSATNIAALPAMTLAKGAGTYRLLVVSLVGDFSVAGTTFQPTITYGGQTLIRITSTDTSSRQKVWIGYLDEAGIAAATGSPPAFAVSGVAPDTGCGLAAAFYNGVDPTTPISGSRAVSSDTAATTPTSGAITVNNGGWAIYASNLNTAIASTPPATWPATEDIDTANAALYQFAVNSKTITATGTEDPRPTWTTIRYAFLSAALNQVSCTDSDPVTDLTLNPLSSGSVSGTYKVTATVIGEGTPNTAGNQTPQALITTTGGDVAGCNVASQPMTWNATGCGGGGCYEYNWNTTACGTVTADTGVTVQVNYTGPDCTESFSKSSTSVTIDNTAPPVKPSTIADCAGCHQYPPVTSLPFADGSARNNPEGQFQGSHKAHVTSNSMPCADCHTVPTDTSSTYFGHRDGNINFQASIKGGTYSKGTSTPQSNTFSGGTCNTSNCHGVNSGTWGTNTTNALCTKCHGVPTDVTTYGTDSKMAAPGYNGTGVDTAGSSAATGTRVGAHDTHLRASNNYSAPIACDNCHTVPAGPTVDLTGADGHLNGGTAEVVFSGLATSNGAAASYTKPNCSTTYCHFGKSIKGYSPATSNATVSWSYTGYLGGTIADCQKCHFSPPLSTGTHSGKGFPATCNTCHTHVDINGVITDPSKHINGKVEAAAHLVPYSGSSHSAAAGTTPFASCNGCHDYTTAGGSYPAGGAAPNCRVCHIQGLLTPSGTNSCWDCHGASATDGEPALASFPNTSASHRGHINTYKIALTCSNCHSGAGSGTAAHGNSNGVVKTDATIAFNVTPSTPTWTNATSNCSVACHISATWGAQLTCISCHAATVYTSAKTRAIDPTVTSRASITAEFGLAWGHKKTGRGAVVDADCIVCHLEGNFTSQQTSTYHANGYIDLRDPDGVGEVAIKNMSGATYSFVRFSTSYAALSRSSTGTTSNNPDNVLTQKFCLACHDSNGATNTTAVTSYTTGTLAKQYMPFGGVYLTGAYLVSNGAATPGGLIDTKSQFATTNSSFHPILGPRLKSYPTMSLLAVPYNNFTRTAGTKSNGVVMNCFDCHNAPTTPLTNRTIVSHGNASTLRGTVFVASPTLCTTCHINYFASSNNHAAGSAFGAITASRAHTTNTCHNCHASSNTVPARPVRAADYHGYNKLLSGANWPAPANSRPYGFIRNTARYTYHRPLVSPETPTGTASCVATACSSDMGTTIYTYTPGGSY